MITINNYFSTNEFDPSSLNETLKKGHDFVEKITSNGSNWDMYHSSDAIKRTVDTYLEKLNNATGTSERKQTSSKERKKSVATFEKPAPKNRKAAARTDTANEPSMVERIPEELRFIRRFVNMNGKIKTKDELLRFINSLQKAIVEKRIRKTSSYSEQIKFIQNKLIDTYNSMKTKITIELKPDTYEKLKNLIGQEKVMISITFIKSYINLNGKTGIKKKADQLLKRITRMMDRKIIPANDPYMDELITITKNLETFLDTPSKKTLTIEKNELNGLEGILGCACQPLNGFDAKPSVMNSMDFAELEFTTIGLKGKWLDFIGDPSNNFTAMVSGKPKMGKSILCIEFAGYLARNHGKVLYVAKEEGLDFTLQQKLHDKNIAHPNLDVASLLPDSLAGYQFIFLDSVNKLGLLPEDLNRLKALNTDKSFVFIFQSTKDGKFRGANTFQHDVDVVIDIPQKGKAVQMGRFNQGGEMEIFEQNIAA